jgi:hypothetical protein
MIGNYKKGLPRAIKQAVENAIDLGYDKQCLKSLKMARDTTEINHIMIAARKRKYG